MFTLPEVNNTSLGARAAPKTSTTTPISTSTAPITAATTTKAATTTTTTTTATPNMFTLSEANNTPLGTRAAPSTTTTTPTTARPAKKEKKDNNWMKGWRPRPTTFGWTEDGKPQITFSSKRVERKVGAMLRARSEAAGRINKPSPFGQGKSKTAVQRRRRREAAEKEKAEEKKNEEKEDDMEVDQAGVLGGGAPSAGAEP